MDGLEFSMVLLIAGAVGFGIGRRRSGPSGTNRLAPGGDGRLEPPGMQTRKALYDIIARRTRLERHLRLLLEAFGPQLARHPPVHFPAPTDDDRMKYLKEAVRFSARRYGVELNQLYVRFHNMGNGQEAGSIRRDQAGFFVQVSEAFRDDDEALVLIAAHELAHYALHLKGIHLESTEEDEELTDALVVLAGFGPLMLRVYHRELTAIVGDQWQSWVSGLGYLHPTAIAYLSLIQVEIAGLEPSETLDWGSAWYREPYSLRESIREESGKGRLRSCMVCATPLPSFDPGCMGLARCASCHVVQRAPAQG